MNQRVFYVKNILQKDNYTFTIEWNDGQKKDYRLSHLQRQCPCANCVDEFTGKPLLDPKTVKDDVKATQLVSVGRYALKISFTSGCSHGIYRFDFLRGFKETSFE